MRPALDATLVNDFGEKATKQVLGARMSLNDPDAVNRLIGKFSDLQEMWESHPETFDWSALEALAQNGAQEYNEGAGPSFQALALDAVDHTEFHERFLDFLLKAGFDPFRLTRPGTGAAPVPVIDHADLADAAYSNPSSTRMRAALMEIARVRFGPLADETRRAGKISSDMYQMVEASAESIPLDLLESIAPELATPHHGESDRRSVNPVEGYLSAAEASVESGRTPYG